MRIEKDNLGELELDDFVYYGIQSLRAKNNFPISGTQIHYEFIHSYLLLKKASAIANFKTKKMELKKSQAIVDAIDKIINTDIIKNNPDHFFIVDTYQAGAGTSQNMNINEVIANIANEMHGYKLGSYTFIHPNDDVNMSQSTNDTYPTVVRLASLNLSHHLKRELSLLSSIFDIKAQQFDHIIKSGRTHLQDAVPIRLGQEFSAYKVTIDQLSELLSQAQYSLQELGIGGSAVGSGINVPHGYSEFIILELRNLFNDHSLRISSNLFSSTQSQLPIMIYSNALRAISLELTRIFNDLRLLSSGPNTGLNEIILPDVQPGSSIMPGKINPSLLEMGNQVMFKVIGNDNAMALAMQAGQLELNVMMPLMAHLSLESTNIMIHAIHAIRENCIKGIKANTIQCERYAGLTSQVVTSLSPIIGYAKAAELIHEAQLEKISIIDLVRRKKMLTKSQFDSVFNLRTMTEHS